MYYNYQTFAYKTTYQNSFVMQFTDGHRTNNMYTFSEFLSKLAVASAVDAVLTIETD